MTESTQIPDQAAREAAATTFDRNVVVIAGAGTGKTTLLVNRLLYLLMRRTDPLDLSRIVALTFTNKAATEMKLRLRERLRGLIEAGCRDASPPQSGTVSIDDLRLRYGWTTDDLIIAIVAAEITAGVGKGKGARNGMQGGGALAHFVQIDGRGGAAQLMSLDPGKETTQTLAFWCGRDGDKLTAVVGNRAWG